MRKLILILVLTLGLAACAGAPATEAPPPTATTAPPTIQPGPTASLPPTVTKPPPTATLPPSATPAPTETPVPTLTATNPPPTAIPATDTPSGPVSYVPLGQSVWEVPVATDNMVGTCASSLSVPYGLIAITEEGGALVFRDQGVGTYTFFKSAPNVYVYSGRSNIAAGNLEMTLTFTGPENWVMHAVTVLDADPGCQHIHDYSAIFKWVR